MRASEIFRDALRATGLDYAGEIIADGKLHRFKAKGDHNRNSWFVLHPGTPAAGAFGCWKLGFKETWCDRSRHLSQAEWDALARDMDATFNSIDFVPDHPLGLCHAPRARGPAPKPRRYVPRRGNGALSRPGNGRKLVVGRKPGRTEPILALLCVTRQASARFGPRTA